MADPPGEWNYRTFEPKNKGVSRFEGYAVSIRPTPKIEMWTLILRSAHQGVFLRTLLSRSASAVFLWTFIQRKKSGSTFLTPPENGASDFSVRKKVPTSPRKSGLSSGAALKIIPTCKCIEAVTPTHPGVWTLNPPPTSVPSGPSHQPSQFDQMQIQGLLVNKDTHRS